MGDERTRPVKIELCSVCGKSNAAGHKWCMGYPGETHLKSRFEWIEVVPASVLEERDQTNGTLQLRLNDSYRKVQELRSQLTEARAFMLKCAAKLRSWDNPEPRAVAEELEHTALVPAPQDREPTT